MTTTPDIDTHLSAAAASLADASRAVREAQHLSTSVHDAVASSGELAEPHPIDVARLRLDAAAKATGAERSDHVRAARASLEVARAAVYRLEQLCSCLEKTIEREGGR